MYRVLGTTSLLVNDITLQQEITSTSRDHFHGGALVAVSI